MRNTVVTSDRVLVFLVSVDEVCDAGLLGFAIPGVSVCFMSRLRRVHIPCMNHTTCEIQRLRFITPTRGWPCAGGLLVVALEEIARRGEFAIAASVCSIYGRLVKEEMRLCQKITHTAPLKTRLVAKEVRCIGYSWRLARHMSTTGF